MVWWWWWWWYDDDIMIISDLKLMILIAEAVAAVLQPCLACDFISWSTMKIRYTHISELLHSLGANLLCWLEINLIWLSASRSRGISCSKREHLDLSRTSTHPFRQQDWLCVECQFFLLSLSKLASVQERCLNLNNIDFTLSASLEDAQKWAQYNRSIFLRYTYSCMWASR